ncbi:MAG: helix-turn-helix transcriptional regulator [Anaerolineae bacterium]|nr:helix-turn-helix transcriptional regulator [Phycisphaerae bacterium]
MIAIVARLIAQSYRSRGERTGSRRSASERTVRQRREIARDAREFCLRHSNQPLGLEDIAAAVGTSRFHLCRVFRAFNGSAIHQYLTELRLRASLERVCDPRRPLARVALEVGFSSQSHFTTSFVRRFSRTWAAFRREVKRG